jgi:DNA replicative helicase MCM subunit Mcm2 (Cdc46/Mcm family)
MTIELALGIVLAVALVVLILLANRQEKMENQMMEETHQKIKVGLHPTPTEVPVEKAAEMVMEEAVAPAPVVVEETPVVVEVVEAVVEAPKVVEEAVVKPKKKRKYKPRNPQNKK